MSIKNKKFKKSNTNIKHGCIDTRIETKEEIFFNQFNRQFWNEMVALAVSSGYTTEDNILVNLVGA